MSERIDPREPLILSEDERARMIALRKGKRAMATDSVVRARFLQLLPQLSDEELAEFEALCFFRAEEVEKPYTALKNAPNMDEKDYVAPLIHATYDRYACLLARMHDSPMESPWQFFAEAVSHALAKPGCVPSLVEADGADFEGSGWFNLQLQLCGAINSYFSNHAWHGLVWDSYFFFQDEAAFGKGTTLAISMHYMTEVGVEFARWLFPERVDELFQVEASVRQ